MTVGIVTQIPMDKRNFEILQNIPMTLIFIKDNLIIKKRNFFH